MVRISRYINLGSGKRVTIKQLVKTLDEFLEFDYEFDTEKSSGFPKRVMDISLAQKLLVIILAHRSWQV